MIRRKLDLSLYLVTDGRLAGARALDDVVRLAVAGGVTTVQVREKSATTREFVETARALRRVTAEAGVALIVNDRIDVALAVDADGVHVGQDDMPAAIARSLLGQERILGVTVADPDETDLAVDAGADYVGCSAVYATATKPDHGRPLGLDGLRGLVRAARLPVVAIGGIHAGNAADVLATGVAGVAVVSAIVGAADPRAAAQELAAAVARGRE